MTHSTAALRPLFLCLLAGSLAVAPGCPGDDSGTDAAAEADAVAEADTAAEADADAVAEAAPDADVEPDVDSTGGCDAGLLTGTWLSTDYSVRFAADLTYEAAGAPNLLTIDVTGQAVVDGCRISFTNEAGSHPCPTDQIGVYDFTVDATTLTFTMVTDLCDGRRIPIDGAVLARE